MRCSWVLVSHKEVGANATACDSNWNRRLFSLYIVVNKYALFALLVNERSGIVYNEVKSKISPVPANSSTYNHISVSKCPTDPQDKNFSQRRLYPHWLKNCNLLLKLRPPLNMMLKFSHIQHPLFSQKYGFTTIYPSRSRILTWCVRFVVTILYLG